MHQQGLWSGRWDEPTSEAWEARNKTLKPIDLAALTVSKDGSNWKLDGN
jgi:hypothetical protein